MTLALVFPGQGSQSVGMLDAFAQNPAVRATLEEASEVLHEDIGRLIATGPAESLALTTTTQPVMLTAGVAIWRAWCAAGGPIPALAAGHSLGEYTALVAAGTMTFAQALPLVRFRAAAMQAAVPIGVGGMAAILGMAARDVAAVCAQAAQGEVVEPANFNDPGQTVISGHASAVERACVLARQEGAKRAVTLAVSAPFHCSLMRAAAGQLEGYLNELECTPPTLPVINNVDVEHPSDPVAIKAALVRQSWCAVRWVETIERMRAEGATHVVECGPGRVLSGLTRRIDRDLVSGALVDPKSIDDLLEMMR